jgi:hypothetical protein
MTDTELLDALDEIHQVPYPTFSARENSSLWSAKFEGWHSPDPSDTNIYPSIRDAIRSMVQ